MSITAETAKEHAKDPAVLCCRAEAGTVLSASNLEDPAIFDDLVDSGLLNLDGCLTIEQILGATLTKTCDSLTPLTPDVLDGVKEVASEEAAEETAVPVAAAPAAPAPVAGPAAGGVLRIHIGEGKDINIELPTGLTSGGAAVAEVTEEHVAGVAAAPAPAAGKEEKKNRTPIR